MADSGEEEKKQMGKSLDWKFIAWWGELAEQAHLYDRVEYIYNF